MAREATGKPQKKVVDPIATTVIEIETGLDTLYDKFHEEFGELQSSVQTLIGLVNGRAAVPTGKAGRPRDPDPEENDEEPEEAVAPRRRPGRPAAEKKPVARPALVKPADRGKWDEEEPPEDEGDDGDVPVTRNGRVAASADPWDDEDTDEDEPEGDEPPARRSPRR